MMKFTQKPQVQETLVHLYLRLNGYFVTGFIVHSEIQGANKSQLDGVAVRHRWSREPEREVTPSPFIFRHCTDLLLCEVKSGENARFNSSLVDDLAAVECVLRWTGLLTEREVVTTAKRLQPLLKPNACRRRCAAGVKIRRGNLCVRALRCVPEMADSTKSDLWVLAGDEIISYLTKCLHTPRQNGLCSQQYDYGAWGPLFEPIVRCFKNETPPTTIGEIYDMLLGAAVGKAAYQGAQVVL